MRKPLFVLMTSALLLSGCASQPKPVAPPPAKPIVIPSDETRSFPTADRTEAKVVDDHLLGHDFLPGGNIAHYKEGPLEYDLVLIKTDGPREAASLLLDFKKSMDSPKMIPHFGGYFGKDGNTPTFVFTKNDWFCGVVGLPMDEADPRARVLADRLK